MACRFPSGWDTFSLASSAVVAHPLSAQFLTPPTIKTRDEHSITVEWHIIENATGYIMRYRREQDLVWETVSSVITGAVAKKKGLEENESYCFSIKPICDNSTWEFSLSSAPYRTQPKSKVQLHPSGCGYATLSGRQQYLSARGITDKAEQLKISESLSADLSADSPLYYWQLFSMLGEERIVSLVSTFYKKVYADTEQPSFRDAFARISDKDHHIQTQAAYWIDSFGGGKYYHGGDYRLNFHHTHNAESVMNASGARRWMFHMRAALREHKKELDELDRRIVPCIVDFLRVKMYKYSCDHSWQFDPSDFDEAGK